MSKTFTTAEDDYVPHAITDQGAFELLESLTPADIAQAVPYVLLWEVDPTTGVAMHPISSNDPTPKNPLSLLLVSPPKFGASIGNEDEFRFRERPPVSLERISIKTENPRGTILYRTINLSFTAHRPDIIFERHIKSGPTMEHEGDSDSWSSLITPGQAFAMEYGWSASSGVKNGILNGDGFQLNTGKKIVNVPGKSQIRFIITNYKFNIGPDAQIKFNIEGYELGEFSLRQAFLTEKVSDDDKKRLNLVKKEEIEFYNDRDAMKKLLHDVKETVGKNKDLKVDKKSGSKLINFGILLDSIFIPCIEKAYKDIGYKFRDLFVGNFNDRCPSQPQRFSLTNVAGKPLSEYSLPMSDVEKIFSDLIKTGTRLTLYNFLRPFMDLMSRDDSWDLKNSDSLAQIPIIMMRNVVTTKNGKHNVVVHIFDQKAEYIKFSSKNYETKMNLETPRAAIKKAVVDNGVPYVSMIRANSYIKDASFEVIQDDQMKGIFMRRYLGDEATNRQQKTSSPDAANKEDNVVPVQQLFAPTIKGSITMLGNFAADVFGLLWLEFGVRYWDGPFFVMSREDTIERGSFLTTIQVMAEGTDPLGTQGRLKAPPQTAPRQPSTNKKKKDPTAPGKVKDDTTWGWNKDGTWGGIK